METVNRVSILTFQLQRMHVASPMKELAGYSAQMIITGLQLDTESLTSFPRAWE